MKNILNNIKKHKKYLYVAVPVLLVLLYIIFGRGGKKVPDYVVEKADVVQSVSLSGKVQTSDRADLGFAAAGRISRIFIQNNQEVAAGATLAQLEIGDLLADLKIKQANLRQENTEVQSAYRALLTEDLEPVPSSSGYDVEPPTISGVYDGAEGQYKINIKKKNITLQDFTVFTFGLEKTETTIDEEGSTPLGTKGLFISFPDADLSEYQDTTWFLDIPNKSGASYLSNLNAYNEAKSNHDLMEQNLNEDSIAQAEIQKIQAEIRKNTIYAPFSGRVTNIEKEVGENASVGERVVSVLGENKLEVVLQVSELDVSKLAPGLPIEITLDAIPDEKFMGTLKTVNSRETEIEGVPVYEAFVELAPDTRIKNGMSAKGKIVLASAPDVVAVPSYLIKKVDGKNLVGVLDAKGKIVEREISIGLSGTDSMLEVMAGLEAGEHIQPLE